MAGILVNGTPRDLDGRAAAHQRAGLPARLRPDRRQGGLRRGGVRRLLGARGPARARRLRGHRVDRDQLLPGAGRDARRPGGRHLRGARRARVAAPGPARDGGARRLAVRLLHARVRVQHGRRVLPVRPGGHQRHGSDDDRTTSTTATTASTCTRSAATCAAAPATGRSRTPRSRSASPPRATRWPPGVRRPRRRPPRPGWTTARRRSSVRRRSPTPCRCSATTPTPWSSPAAPTGASRSTSRASALRPWSRWTGSPELRGFTVSDDEIRIGAALTLTEVERRLDGRLPILAALMPQFASPLIRNGATLGGNLGTGSPIGDAPPVLLALEASLVLASADGERTVPLADYFTGYRESVREPGELITEVVVPLPAAALTAFHKIAKRPFDDISSVAVGFALDVGGRRRRARRGSGWAGSPRPRSGRWPPRRRWRGSRGRPRPSRPRPRCSRARAPRSPTSGPARTTGRRCSGSRCGSCWHESGTEVTA